MNDVPAVTSKTRAPIVRTAIVPKAKPVSAAERDERALAQPGVGRCALCPWEFAGPMKDVIAAQAEHRLDYSLESNPSLKRPAVSWPDQRVVRFRSAREEAKREALAHELGHCCSDHPGSGRFCGARAWASPDWSEREAHRWAEDFLMPLHLLEPWIVDLGPGLRISRVAALCRVTDAFARRRLRHAGYDGLVWDDTAPGAYRASS